MSFIFIIIGTMLALDAAWWIISTRAAKGGWRIYTGVFMAAQVAGLLAIIGGRMLRWDFDRVLPKFAVTAVFLWHFFGIAALLVIGLCALPILLARWLAKLLRRKNAVASGPAREGEPVTRRDFLGIAAAVAPSLFTISLTTIAMRQLDSFRVRRFELPVAGLQRDLDGLTIAQVSDIHTGRFTSGRVLGEMVKRTNELGADLVLLTGDLINDALSDLPNALDIARAMQGRHGVCMIEGNHDLIENPAEFERAARASGIPFLVDQSATLTIRGCPVQLLGLRWERHRGGNRDALISESVRELLKQREADAFPILLAHHPHAFDAAAEAGVPLVLSGHTHGGQLMLNDHTGFGPELFRYWSGLYTRGVSRMIVSNGAGNWFPIRVNAPAEIVHITLRMAV